MGEPGFARVLETEEYTRWFAKLRDARGRARIMTAIDRFIEGNHGSVRSVGGEVSELKVDYGPGYRVYFTVRQGVLMILLCGGDKDSQDRDIVRAKRLASGIEVEG